MNRRGRALTWLDSDPRRSDGSGIRPSTPRSRSAGSHRSSSAAACRPPADAPRAARSARQALPWKFCDERGLQVQTTILAERAISKRFPEIKEMSGVRPDSMKWHPNGFRRSTMILTGIPGRPRPG